ASDDQPGAPGPGVRPRLRRESGSARLRRARALQLHRFRLEEQRAGREPRMFLIPARRPSRERLDDPNLPTEEMARSLADIALVNRRWGGSHALARHIGARLRSDGASRARILDVGAGSGDVLRRLARELGREGFDVTTVAVDLQWRHLVAGWRM